MRDDGGPAFPAPYTHDPASGPLYHSQCMSLRDYFAAAALTGLLANEHFMGKMIEAIDGAGRRRIQREEVNRITSRRAYLMADAMLREREKGA